MNARQAKRRALQRMQRSPLAHPANSWFCPRRRFGVADIALKYGASGYLLIRWRTDDEESMLAPSRDSGVP